MKTRQLLATALMASLGATSAHAVLHVYEGFDYTIVDQTAVGADIDGQLDAKAGGTGFAAPWQDMTAGSNNGLPFIYGPSGNTIASNGSKPDWDGVIDNVSQTGGYVSLSPFSNDQQEDRLNARRTLAQSAGAMAGADRILWASMVVHFEDNRFFFAPGFALTDGGAVDGGGFQERVQNLSDAAIGLGIGNGGPPINDGKNATDITLAHYDFGTRDESTKTNVSNLDTAVADYLIVLKYEFGDSSDMVSAWFFAETDTIDEATFNANAPTMTTAINVDENTLTTLAVGLTRAGNAYDEIRIGDTFADVTPGATALIPGDTDGDGDVDDSDLGTSFSNYTGPGGTGKTVADGDTDGDGDVDDGDLGTSFSNYTGPLGPSVPEPTSLALIALGGLALARRRRA